MQRYWFKQKRYGFGAAPASWQGWALTALYLIGIVALGAWFSAAPEPRALAFFTITLVLTVIFVAVCWRTTEGGWRWRWGERD